MRKSNNKLRKIKQLQKFHINIWNALKKIMHIDIYIYILETHFEPNFQPKKLRKLQQQQQMV